MKDANKYYYILIKTYQQSRESSVNKIRAFPLAGQGLDTTLKVNCSTAMRDSYPVGSVFRVIAKITDREGTPFVYSNHTWEYILIEEKDVVKYLGHYKVAKVKTPGPIKN
jgi:hypothetical protein